MKGSPIFTPSFPRSRESITYALAIEARSERIWIPAFAGMTSQDGKYLRYRAGANAPALAGTGVTPSGGNPAR